MSHERDEQPSPGTLPPAELNPLLNPLLAENMGRWAEIYFTSPPEHREQAVLELLRELEAEKARQEQNPAVAHSSRTTSNLAQRHIEISRDRLEETSATAGPLIRCAACGRDNPASHRFCGMCGAPLVWENEQSSNDALHTPAQPIDESANIESSRRQWRTESNPRDFEPSHSNGNELSLFQSSPQDQDHSWVYEPEPVRSYRFYVGAVLAVIILALGYMAWRGMQSSQNSQQITAAPPAPVSDTPSPAPSNPNTHSPAASPNTPATSPGEKADTSTPSSAPVTPAESKPAEPARTPEPTPAKAAATAIAPNTTPAIGNGSEELALAQRYLSGTTGQRRDTAEAAKWLWKSIAKHNGEATVLLADLYLRGDGVSKNCDQARILLDSAARKGVAGAGERLRNLQAFGCQ